MSNVNNENEILSFEELRKKLGMDDTPTKKTVKNTVKVKKSGNKFTNFFKKLFKKIFKKTTDK